MKQSYSSLKIDAYAHISPPKFQEAFNKLSKPHSAAEHEPRSTDAAPKDLESRFQKMDRYEPLVQVLVMHPQGLPDIASEKAVDLVRRGNDEVAELVARYPDRFVAAIALLPMNDMDAALKEADRAIKDLGLRGVCIPTHVNDKPLDSPEFMPLYEKMCQYNLPIYTHPSTHFEDADYRTENTSKYKIYKVFGWPYATTVMMTRFVFSGILERYPNLKIVTHHCGAMVPYFVERIKEFYDVFLSDTPSSEKYRQWLTKAPIEYFKMFHNDTALYGGTSALMCAYDFFGADHLLFATDFPAGDTQVGSRNYRQTIDAIEQMDISDVEKKKIFEDNARSLLNLPI